jgi:pimeloyl-CoA synthetase
LRKKIPGLFSDETNGRTVTEFIALRVKSYAYILDNKEKIKVKGIRGIVVKNHMTFKDYIDCLFTNDEEKVEFDLYRENVSIRSYNHEL